MPSISLPSGLDGQRLPLAIQLVGAPLAEARLLGAAAWCERAIGFAEAPARCLTSSSRAGASSTAPARRRVRADVGVQGDAIAAVGDLSREPAGRVVDAGGLVVTPGFIDMHSHSDWCLSATRRAESKIRQGVTTEVVGNCGFSPAPVSDEYRADMRGFALHKPPRMDFGWRSMGEYLDALRRRRHRAERDPARRARHDPPGRDGLRAARAHGARAARAWSG